MTRGGRICFFSSLRSSRLAACLSRRRWTKTSRTTPVWSTARHIQCFTPTILSATSSRCHLSPTRGKAATDLIGEPLAELARPLPHGFMADDDATRGQQLLHHAQPEREAEIEPDGMADDLSREAIPGVAGASRCRHPTRLLTPACRRKRGKARQVDGASSTLAVS